MQLPAVVGADAPYQNTADMRTRGWELSFNWREPDWKGELPSRFQPVRQQVKDCEV